MQLVHKVLVVDKAIRVSKARKEQAVRQDRRVLAVDKATKVCKVHKAQVVR